MALNTIGVVDVAALLTALGGALVHIITTLTLVALLRRDAPTTVVLIDVGDPVVVIVDLSTCTTDQA